MMLPLLLAATLALSAPPHAIDLGAQLIGIDLVVSAGTARQTAAQNGLAALTAQTLLFTKIDGTRLTDRIAADGGSIDYAVDPGVVRFSFEVLPGALPAVSADLARALTALDTSADTVNAARTTLATRIADDESNPVTVGVEMLRNSYYRGTAGAPSFGTSASLAQLGPSDVAAFFAAHYLRGDAFATATGAVEDAAGRQRTAGDACGASLRPRTQAPGDLA
jgi:predicted Zn-dependent peptidase